MKLFDIDNKKVIVHPEALLVTEFKNIWIRDKSKTKDVATQELSYVLFMSDFKSPYMYYAEDARPDKIRRDCMTIDNWTPDELIITAIEKYKELQRTPSMGLLEDAQSAISKIRKYFRDVDVSTDDTGNRAKTLVANLKALGDLVASVQKISDLVEKEVSEARIKGQGRLGLRETPRDRG